MPNSIKATLLAAAAFWLCAAEDPVPVDATAVQRAMKRGIDMFWLDRAAWVTSSDIQGRISPDRAAQFGGWIITPSGDGYHADYFGKGDHADRVIYAADVQGKTVGNATVYPVTAEPKLTGVALLMAQALTTAQVELARHADWQSCGPAPFNTIVLPPENDGVVAVFFLTPQTEHDSFPFGGHFEIDVDGKGNIKTARAFTKGCLTVSKAPEPKGAKPLALFLNHLLDPQPTEIHVFEQFGTKVPLYVGTPTSHAMWRVENGTITQVTDQKSR